MGSRDEEWWKRFHAEGADAARRGVGFEENPAPSSTARFLGWQIGWSDEIRVMRDAALEDAARLRRALTECVEFIEDSIHGDDGRLAAPVIIAARQALAEK